MLFQRWSKDLFIVLPRDVNHHEIEDVARRKHLSDVENYPNDALTSYEEFKLDGKTYYFTPGGFLYRKDPGTIAVGGFFCGYLTDEVWHYRSADG
jgi:hypothetical protein